MHIIVFPYIIVRYYQTTNDAYVNVNELYESRKVWVPMDCILTLSVAAYYFMHWYYDQIGDSDFRCNSIRMVDNEQAKISLLGRAESSEQKIIYVKPLNDQTTYENDEDRPP